jgi:hypothetical protein
MVWSMPTLGIEPTAVTAMFCDGKRKRRTHPSRPRAQRQWYSTHRSRRFARRFGFADSVGEPRV